MNSMLTLEKFEQASELVKKVTLPTKLVYSEYLSEQTGGKVYLKPENMQFTGAYKVRGAYYKMSTDRILEVVNNMRKSGKINSIYNNSTFYNIILNIEFFQISWRENSKFKLFNKST